VAGDQHGAAFAGQVPQQVSHPPDPVRVQAVERLVHDQHARITEQGGGQGQPLAHAQGETPDPAVPVLSEAHQAQHLGGPGPADPGRGRYHPQVLERAAARVEAVVVERGSDASGRVGQAAVAEPVDGRGAVVRSGQAQQHPQRGGLARAVGSQEAGDPARPDLEAQPVDRDDIPIPLGEMVHSYHQVRPPCRSRL
jgi:hypothetical protein